MSKREGTLDTSNTEAFSSAILDAIDDHNMSTEEAIPALVQAILQLAGMNYQYLEEAANMLADGGA